MRLFLQIMLITAGIKLGIANMEDLVVLEIAVMLVVVEIATMMVIAVTVHTALEIVQKMDVMARNNSYKCMLCIGKNEFVAFKDATLR